MHPLPASKQSVELDLAPLGDHSGPPNNQATQTLSTDTTTQSISDELTLAEQQKAITTTASAAAIAGVGDLSSGVLRYATTIAMTHMVSPTIYGAFGTVSTIALTLTPLARLGLEGVLVRLLPLYRTRDQSDLIAGLLRFTTAIVLGFGLLIGILFFAYAAPIALQIYHNPAYLLPIRELAPLIPLIALHFVSAAGLQAFKYIKWKVALDHFAHPVITLVTLVIFYWLGWRLEALSLSAILGYLFTVLISQVILHKTARRYTLTTPARYIPRTWSRFTAPLFCYSIVHTIAGTTNILLLSIFSTPGRTGIYLASERVSYFIAIPFLALSLIFSPLIVEYHTRGRHQQVATMLKMVTRWSFVCSLPIFLGCLIFHDTILALFGHQYRTGGSVLILLCASSLILAITRTTSHLLAMIGSLRLITLNSIATLAIHTGLSFFLIQRFGVLGAAIATLLTPCILDGLCLIEVYWIMKIHPYRQDMYKPLIAGSVASVVALLLLHLAHPGTGRLAHIETLSLLLPFLLAYVLVMIWLRLSAEDHVVLARIRARFGKQPLD